MKRLMAANEMSLSGSRATKIVVAGLSRAIKSQEVAKGRKNQKISDWLRIGVEAFDAVLVTFDFSNMMNTPSSAKGLLLL